MWSSFYCRNCELSHFYRQKKKLQIEYENDDELDYDVIRAEEDSILEQLIHLLRLSPYLLTGQEHLNSRNIYPKIKDETLKLLEFKVVTPEEMFNRKLNESEYIEALEVAKLYSLDTDIVYQTQWINSKITSYAINEYLSKVKRKDWVIHECVERIGDTFSAQKALIEYGLKLTDSSFLLSIDKSSASNVEEDSSEKSKPREEQFLKCLNFKSLSLEQKDIINCRLKLLKYLRRLKTYEAILGDASLKDRFDSNFFGNFRKQSEFEAAISFARDANPKSVSAMLTYHSEETLQHWLAIISSFPETLSPLEYKTLLPKCTNDSEDVVAPKAKNYSCDDWCLKHFSDMFSSSSKETEFEQKFYAENEDLVEFVETKLTKSLVSNWFHKRARQIEDYSSLIKYAVKLVEIGIDNNIPILEKLYDDLDTYSTVIYQCLPLNVSVSLNFSKFEELNDQQKIDYLMHSALEKPEEFTVRIKCHLLPFLQKCEKHSDVSGVYYCYLSNYMTSVAKNDLSLCCKVFEKNDSEGRNLIIQDKEHLLSLAVECIYACEQPNQLQSACSIIECLPPREDDVTHVYAPFYERLDDLDKHLGVADLLEEYNCFVSVRDVRDMQMDKNGEEIKRLISQITRVGAKKSEPHFKEKEWFQMFNDLLEMRSDCFEDCITLDEIYEIFVNALLTSGRRENFGLASSYMQLINDPSVVRKKKLIPFKKSVQILVASARDYINSANSISDNAIDLAKNCLMLINDVEKCENEMVREELAFLEALDMLYKDFNVKLLPIQIRLIQQPKLELVAIILSEDSRAYRRWQKMLKICDLLNVCKDDDQKVRHGKILTLIGGYAYKANELKECWNICKVIMDNEYISGCNLCKKLAFCDSFNDDEAKLDMLTFVVSYCDDKSGDEIECALEKLREIKLRLKLMQQASVAPEKRIVDYGVNQVSKTAQQLSSWISSFSSFKK